MNTSKIVTIGIATTIGLSIVIFMIDAYGQTQLPQGFVDMIENEISNGTDRFKSNMTDDYVSFIEKSIITNVEESVLES